VKKQPYVAGLLMTEDCRYVVLIRKAKPEWQRGRLNGVGGKIESGDQTSVAAMVREFREETGLTVKAERWQRFATVAGAWGSVKFFRAFGHIEELMQAKTTAPDEGAVGLFWIDDALLAECLPNLSWLLPLARYRHDRYAPVLVAEVAGGGTR
jgi:8-oxo-dGTP diphosphatase